MSVYSGQSTGDVLVRFKSVNKSYDGVNLAVRDLDLEVRNGEFLSLLGASGSGKTTTLMMLAGFERPTSGRIELNGKPLDNVPPWQRNIGIVFQSYALFPHMTVAQNIGFPLRQRRRSLAETIERVRDILALVQLEGVENRLPNQLSGGQQQRVALARALVFEPQLVLMDEPLGALDKRLREHMQLELKRIHARLGVTIVYVTHDQSEALAMSDRIAVFAYGRIRQIAEPSTLYEAPTDMLVADFVGDNNRIDGVVIAIDGGRCRVQFDGNLIATAKNAEVVSTGNSATLMVRPERIVVGNSVGADNTFKALVDSVVYLGDHAKLIATLPSGRTLTAKLMNSTGCVIPEAGAQVQLSWQAQDCLAFSGRIESAYSGDLAQ